jgi:hypothetical protein
MFSPAQNNSTCGKVKAKLSLCLIEHDNMKMYVQVEVQFHAFLPSTIGGGGRSASRFGPYTPGKKPLPYVPIG